MGNNHSNNTAKKIAIGASVAAVAGYVTGLLTAPKSGKQTRDDIKAGANKGLTDAERELKKLHTELADLIGEVKDRGDKLSGKATKEVGGVLEKGKVAKEKARELLSALHEGDAEDKDLKRAVNEASKAIEHLKNYLKK
jgi:gas vesicle protein